MKTSCQQDRDNEGQQGHQAPLHININNTNLKQVKEFKYLGSVFTEDGRMNKEIEYRIQKTNNQLVPLLKHPEIPMGTKSKIINSTSVPTLTYQCQTWTMTKSLERKIITWEMRCLRKAVNKTRRDMIPNTKIREMVGTKSIHRHIQQQRIKWFGHLTQLPKHHPAQRVHNTRGRPPENLDQWSQRDTIFLQHSPCPGIPTCSRQNVSLSSRDAPSGISGRQK